MKTEQIRVELGERSYDIVVGGGLLENAGEYLAPHLSRKRTVIVTDQNVYDAQAEKLTAGLKKSGVASDFIILPPGESTKSFSELEKLTQQLLNFDVERGDVIIAFGGGVIGDLTGFAASILRRGCRFAQIPTTLLAQVDSSVGGKTAINVPQGKNLIGAFYQPCLVLSDISALDTLPARQMRAGYAEVVKYGLIDDKSFFEWLEENGAALLSGGEAERQYAVQRSCEAKARIVAADETEKGCRALLNLGHTFGHAFEAAYGYSDALFHGEAVALGMCLAFDFSARLGMCGQEDADRVKTHIANAGLPSSISDLGQNGRLTSEELTRLMLQDKKMESGKLTLILAESIGGSKIVKDASIPDIQTFLGEKLAGLSEEKQDA